MQLRIFRTWTSWNLFVSLSTWEKWSRGLRKCVDKSSDKLARCRMVSATRSHTSCANVPVSWSLIWFRRRWQYKILEWILKYGSCMSFKIFKTSHFVFFPMVFLPKKSRCFPPIFLGSQTTWRSGWVSPPKCWDPARIERGEDARTTVMVRNVAGNNARKEIFHPWIHGVWRALRTPSN